MSTPCHSKKTTDWAEYEINEKKWLPLDIKIESIAEVICNLGLRHMNISDDNNLFKNFDEEKVIGFFCKATKEIEFEEKEDYSKSWTFIPVKIENSTPTIQILNLCAVNGKNRDYGYLLEKYIRDSSKENCALSNAVYAITPIPFSHNTSAKNFPAPIKELQQTYVFAKLNNQLVLIGNDGRLYTFKQSNLSANQFLEFAKNELKCDVYIIVEDPFKELNRKLEEKKAELAALVPEEVQNKSNGHLDDSLSYDDLKELSELSAQIESAQSFELMVDGGSANVSNNETYKPAKYLTKKKHRLEEQIRDLVKEIEDTKKLFPHIYWPAISDSDLYGSKEYLKFYAHYKKVIHVTTPKMIKSYSIAPIRTPKTAERKRTVDSASFSTNQQVSIPTGTPKRRRSSKPLHTKQ